MKVLFAGEQAAGHFSLYRRQALQRMGHTVVTLDPQDYVLKNSLLQKVAFRLAAGPHAERLNRDLLRLAKAERPDIFWAEKILLLQPATLRKLSEMGIVTVSYMIDNAFGPRNDPGWRLYKQDIPFFDLHVTQRDVSIPHYTERGAKNVMKVQTAYEQTVHFPPPPGWSDKDRESRGLVYGDAVRRSRGDPDRSLRKTGLPIMISGRRHGLGEVAEREAMMKKIFYERPAVWRTSIARRSGSRRST